MVLEQLVYPRLMKLLQKLVDKGILSTDEYNQIINKQEYSNEQ